MKYSCINQTPVRGVIRCWTLSGSLLDAISRALVWHCCYPVFLYWMMVKKQKEGACLAFDCSQDSFCVDSVV